MGNGNSTPQRIRHLSASTHFKENKLKRWHKQFMKRYPNGKVNREQFIKLYKEMCKNKDFQDFGEHMFRSFDTDKDNQISFDELVWSFSITSRGSTEEQLRWSFPIYDLDQDGYVTVDEVIAMLRCFRGSANGATPNEDIDLGDVAEMFKKVDTDKNGCWSVDEFVEGMKKDPELVKLLNPLLSVRS